MPQSFQTDPFDRRGGVDMECSGGSLVSVVGGYWGLLGGVIGVSSFFVEKRTDTNNVRALKKEPTPITFGITEARPHPRSVSPAKNHLGEMDHRIYFVSQSKLPVPRSLRASEPVEPRERGGNDGTVSEPSQLCGCLSLSD